MAKAGKMPLSSPLKEPKNLALQEEEVPFPEFIEGEETWFDFFVWDED